MTTSPDVAVSWESANVGQFCAPGGFEDLGPWLERDGVDMANFAEFNQIYQEYVVQPYPARTTVPVNFGPMGLVVDCIAVVK